MRETGQLPEKKKKKKKDIRMGPRLVYSLLVSETLEKRVQL